MMEISTIAMYMAIWTFYTHRFGSILLRFFVVFFRETIHSCHREHRYACPISSAPYHNLITIPPTSYLLFGLPELILGNSIGNLNFANFGFGNFTSFPLLSTFVPPFTTFSKP